MSDLLAQNNPPPNGLTSALPLVLRQKLATRLSPALRGAQTKRIRQRLTYQHKKIGHWLLVRRQKLREKTPAASAANNGTSTTSTTTTA